MPVLTRSAQRALNASESESESTKLLVLRESVTAKADAVWEHRGGVDVYSGATRDDTINPQVDHQLEVQLGELALVRAYTEQGGGGGGGGVSMAAAQAAKVLRVALNGVSNLNVTSARHNQSKRGPMSAALNRLQNDRLRTVDIEQLARQGKAKWLVDNGDWARIERAVVESYDQASDWLRDEALGAEDGLPGAQRVIDGTVEELGSMLDKIGLR